MASGLCEAKVKGKTVPDFGASEGDGPLSERPSVCRRHTKNRNCQELSKADERVGIYAVIRQISGTAIKNGVLTFF